MKSLSLFFKTLIIILLFGSFNSLLSQVNYIQDRAQAIEYLTSQREDIYSRASQIGATGEIIGPDMEELCQMVNSFNNDKEDLKRLFGDLSVKFDEKIQNAVKYYQAPWIRHGSYNNEIIRVNLSFYNTKAISKVRENFKWTFFSIFCAIMLFGLAIIILDRRRGNNASLGIPIFAFGLIVIVLGLYGGDVILSGVDFIYMPPPMMF